MRRVVVTGAEGLLGWHCSVRLHALNRAAAFRGEPEPFLLVRLGRADFNDPFRLRAALTGADAVLHFAGINRGPDDVVERGNVEIANCLAMAWRDVGDGAHIVYANSIHADRDTPYGRSKGHARDILGACAPHFTDLILPHIFGEGARPFYNNVTATFAAQVIAGETPIVNPAGEVQLLHAGAAAEAAIQAVFEGHFSAVHPQPRTMRVSELLDRIREYHADYRANLFPNLTERFALDLFNTYRSALSLDRFPQPLNLNTDVRGVLFEAVKGGGGGQTFLSWTEPGVTRGDHFHLHKVERFLVLEGAAVIRIRPTLGERVWEYRVDGKVPSAIDMPTMHTHSIENVGDTPLLTMFWAHELFDPARPDTYADPVLR